MDASLFSEQDYAPRLPSLKNTYEKHIITVNSQKVPQMACIAPRATYVDKIQEILVKWAKVDGCKPILQARLR
jgi:hypothetical protein